MSRPTHRVGGLFGRAFPELRAPLAPFGRLAVTHVLMISGDAFVTVALAGSLFFSISPGAARGRVALYLLLTMAPFAVVGPGLGPMLDRSRGARRAMVMGSAAARTVLCLLMARHLHSLLLFPEAFLVLVASKLYLVAKAALVPATVDPGPDLVRANSRLALLSGLAGLIAAGPAVALLKIPGVGASWVLRVDAALFVVAAVSASRLPRSPRRREVEEQEAAEAAAREETDRRRRELPPGEWPTDEIPAVGPAPRRYRWAPDVLAAASAMAVLRWVVGLVTFLLAFELRRQHAASWWFGAVLAVSVAGSLLATLVAPVLRRWMREEAILLAAMVAVAVAAAGAFQLGGRRGDALLTAAVGLGAAAAKLGFDSLVQRDVPETARGRAFGRFETRFQLAWVVGALVPVAVPMSSGAGELVVAIVVAVAAAFYLAGRTALGRTPAPRPS